MPFLTQAKLCFLPEKRGEHEDSEGSKKKRRKNMHPNEVQFGGGQFFAIQLGKNAKNKRVGPARSDAK